MATKIRARIAALAALTRRTAREPRLLQIPDIFGRAYTLDLDRMRLIPPLSGGSPEGDEGGEGAGEAGEGAAAEGGGDGAAAGDDGGHDADHYRKQLREYERTSKRRTAAKDAEIERLKSALAEREDADKTEHERALEQARQEARDEVLSQAEKERRSDRLEVAVARQAAKTFADVDDALLHVERGIAAGDIDADDIFDDQGKVQTDALKTALEELLERKPHLAATTGPGSSDAGRGGGQKGLEDMSVEDHVKRVQRK